MKTNARVIWKKMVRKNGYYYLGKLNSKNIKWCITTIRNEEGYWLCPTGQHGNKQRTKNDPGIMGPFSEPLAAMACFETIAG